MEFVVIIDAFTSFFLLEIEELRIRDDHILLHLAEDILEEYILYNMPMFLITQNTEEHLTVNSILI